MADYADQTIRIVDTTDTAVLENTSFERCVILGPAVVVPAESRFISCSFEGEPEAVIWEIPPNRKRLLGAIKLDACSFNDCQFKGIGLGLSAEAAQEFLNALAETASAEATTEEPVAR
jgi:hypothetical protein